MWLIKIIRQIKVIRKKIFMDAEVISLHIFH